MLQNPSWTELGRQSSGFKVGLYRHKVGPGPQTPVSPTSPLHVLDPGESWYSRHVTDGPRTGEEAVGYERFDRMVLPEGGVNL